LRADERGGEVFGTVGFHARLMDAFDTSKVEARLLDSA
jgi:hypothetical protein